MPLKSIIAEKFIFSAWQKSLLLHGALIIILVISGFFHTLPKPKDNGVIKAYVLTPSELSSPKEETPVEVQPTPTPEKTVEPATITETKPEPVQKTETKPRADAAIPKNVAKTIVPEKTVTIPKPTEPSKPRIKPALNTQDIDAEMAALRQETQAAQEKQKRLAAEREKALAQEKLQQAKLQQQTLQNGERERFKQLIDLRLQQKWRRPASAQSSMKTVLRISVLPGGEVLNVLVVSSSGNAAFDTSAINAVKDASPLPVPGDPALFNKDFRTIVLTFTPKDL